jgi:hypothetical protein
LRPATDPIRAFSLKKTVHKFVDVKTKKSKEVSVRCFGRREWESGDRFRLFFSFPFFSSFRGRRQIVFFSLSRGLEKERRIFNKRNVARAEPAAFTLARRAFFLSQNERATD